MRDDSNTPADAAQDGTHEPLLQHALSYHRCGYRVIPLESRGKCTFEKDWPELHLDHDGIAARWRAYPDRNLELLCGTELRDAPCFYLAAIDVDVDDERLIERVRCAISGDAPAKRGRKGVTLFVHRSFTPSMHC